MLSSRRDHGAVAVFVAGSLALLMGMAALTIDIGFGFNERRADQSAADSGALGGSLELVITNQPNPVQAAVDQVYSLVDTNLGRTIPLADWSACHDANALFWTTDDPMFATTNGSPCISMSEDFNTFRVRVPTQDTQTTFGAVIGFASVSTFAAAEAERNIDWGGGGDFPSGVLDGTGAGQTICVKTGTGSSAHQSCGDPSTGDFGNFRPFFYSAVDGDASSICVSGEANLPMARSMADGIDHEFSAWNPVTQNTRVNGAWCASGVPGPPLPNTVDSAAGYHNADITNGLILGGTWPSTHFDGRFARGPYVGGASVFDTVIDNRPLWDYIDDTNSFSLAPTCDVAKAWPATVPLTEFPLAMQDTITCIQEAIALDPVPAIFTGAILNTPRLVHAPLYWEDQLAGNNADPYHIQGVVPVFLDGVWARNGHPTFVCSGEFDGSTPGMCIHHPGLTGFMDVNPPGQKVIDSASGIVLRCSLLPSMTCPSIQDGSNPLNILYDLQLTR